MEAPHEPVLIDRIIEHCAPIQGLWCDGTFGAGGYSKALIRAGASRVIALDRDPNAIKLAQNWIGEYSGHIELHHARFSQMEDFAEAGSLDGVVLDIGVSSMQLDDGERGFSFTHDGPLDMRMDKEGRSAADLINALSESEIADILYQYGDERASRRIAHALVKARGEAPIMRTSELAGICERALGRQNFGGKKTGAIHPATRTFQALRIVVNREFEELEAALRSSLTLLRAGGLLVVVSFHSGEDRIVKRFFQTHGKAKARPNRFAPEAPTEEDTKNALGEGAEKLKILTAKPIRPDQEETRRNIRARSARLRIAQKIITQKVTAKKIIPPEGSPG